MPCSHWYQAINCHNVVFSCGATSNSVNAFGCISLPQTSSIVFLKSYHLIQFPQNCHNILSLNKTSILSKLHSKPTFTLLYFQRSPSHYLKKCWFNVRESWTRLSKYIYQNLKSCTGDFESNQIKWPSMKHIINDQSHISCV